ncbi:hypothetical protein ACQY0O_000100 [Thecaphora frezii]
MSSQPRYPPPGKTAIVTGSSSGIGRVTAIALARAGWNVCLTGRREQQLIQTLSLLHNAAGREDGAIYVVGDISNEEVVARVFEETAAKFGRVDLVFANAGISPPNVPIMEQKLEDWKATVDVNLTASWLCAREAFRYMSRQQPEGGRIVLNGSLSAYTPRPCELLEREAWDIDARRTDDERGVLVCDWLSSLARLALLAVMIPCANRTDTQPYTATKHAITGLAKSLSLDGRVHNIAVTQLDIGNAASDMTAKMKNGPGVLQANLERRHEDTFDSRHVADIVVHVAGLELEVNRTSPPPLPPKHTHTHNIR